MALIKCESCGNLISENASACPKCGQPAKAHASGSPNNIQYSSSSSKSRTTTAIIALLLGGIGIHYFYLGKPIAGLLFLVLCWTYIPALIAFVQAIMMFTMSDAQFYEKYANNPKTIPLF
jgi:TM2 domain-containing membrane protein YozV